MKASVSARNGVDAGSVLDEFRDSGLDLDALAGNTGKLRLSLDLASLLREHGRLRVLDVGCAGPLPLNVWAPFAPLADRLEVVGVDVANIERARSRADELGFGMELRKAGIEDLARLFGEAAFDVVVSTQVLEHVPDWRAGLAQMAAAVRPGGHLLVTCDSGDLGVPRGRRARLAAKRGLARLLVRRPSLRRITDRAVSGEWERGITAAEMRAAAEAEGLGVERLAHYALGEAKTAQRAAGGATGQLWLAFEEALAAESGERLDVGLLTVLYLRARRGPLPTLSAR